MIETIENLRAKSTKYMSISGEHQAKFLTYEDRSSQGAQEQLFLFGVYYGRASAYHQLALDMEAQQ